MGYSISLVVLFLNCVSVSKASYEELLINMYTSEECNTLVNSSSIAKQNGQVSNNEVDQSALLHNKKASTYDDNKNTFSQILQSVSCIFWQGNNFCGRIYESLDEGFDVDVSSQLSKNN